MTNDQGQRERTRALLQDPEWVKRSEKFREHIFETHRFTLAAREFIRANSRIIVLDFASEQGGGGYWPPGNFGAGADSLVQLFTAQHESAVHELSHVWWHFWRLHHPGLKKDLVRNLVTLSGLNPEKYPEWAEAINLAYIYVYGNKRDNEIWLGMLGDADGQNNPANLPRDIHNLTEEDFEARVNDWEIFAGLASFTMGRFNEGPRKIPPSMYIYFEPLFMGDTEAVNAPPLENPVATPPAVEESEANLEESEPTAVEPGTGEPEMPEPLPPEFVPKGSDPLGAEGVPVGTPAPAPEEKDAPPRTEPPPVAPPAQESPAPSVPSDSSRAESGEVERPVQKEKGPSRVSGAASGHTCMLAAVLYSLTRR